MVLPARKDRELVEPQCGAGCPGDQAGKCKWSINPVGTNILEDLKRRAGALAQESGIEHFQYAQFARKGFTEALKEQARREQIGLFTVEDLIQSQE